jgi:predicted Zn finger-like uncharacterized protein
MIIQCPDCKARFRLADEKVKTEGTKVRCTKCQNVFMVAPPPPSEAPREPVAEAPDFFEDQSAAGADMDPAAFDFGSDDSLLGEEAFGKDPEGDTAADLGSFGDLEPSDDGFSGGDDDFALGGAESFQEEMAFSWDPPAAEESDPATLPGEAVAEKPAEPEACDEPEVPAPEPLDDEPSDYLPGMEGLGGENNPKKIPPPASRVAGPPKSRRGGLVLLLLLLLGGAVAAGYWMWRSGMMDLNRVLAALHIAESPAAPSVLLKPVDLQGSFVKNRKEGRLFVIQGQVRNEAGEARSAIAVKGVLYDGKDGVLLQRTVFCGNPLSLDELRSMSFAEIVERMNNQFGDSLANFNVPPGKTISFTIVFNRLPEGLASFDVKLSGSEPASR